MTPFVARADDLPAVREVRARVLGDHRQACTLVVVQGPARPEILTEIEAFAART